MTWYQKFKESVFFRKIFLLVFVTSMILFRTLLNRNLWLKPLSNVMGGWGIWETVNGEQKLTTECISNKYLPFPTVPFKTRPVKFQSKNRREKAARTTNNLLRSHLVSAHPHKIHSKIALQSRKITGRGEYLGRANAPAEAPGPGRSEEWHTKSHENICE